MATLALPAAAPPLSRDAVYRARYIIAFAVTLASVLELVDTSIVNVTIPHMMGNLGVTLEEVAWVRSLAGGPGILAGGAGEGLPGHENHLHPRPPSAPPVQNRQGPRRHLGPLSELAADQRR